MDLSTKQGRREQGLRIQRAVEQAGLSIEEIAGRIGCSRALIYQYLSGSTLAQPDRLQQIAAECGVGLDTFYQVSEFDSASSEGSTVPAVPVDTDDAATRLSETLRWLQDLATAQESPPNPTSLVSTCERIYGIAGLLGNRVLQAQTMLRQGNASLRISDYSSASDSLRTAIRLATEIGEPRIELDARQSLGHVLVSMGNLNEARQQFTASAASAHVAARWKGVLSLGSVHTMLGEYREAMESFDRAAAILETAEQDGTYTLREAEIGMLYVNGNRINVYINGGDFRGARPLIDRCVQLAESYGIADEHLEAKFDLAFCQYCTGNWSDAYLTLSSVILLARFVGHKGKEAIASAWLGQLLAAAGDYASSLQYGKDALAAAMLKRDRRGELYAQLALADACLGQDGRESEARYHAGQALAVAASMRMERAEIECRLRLCRVADLTGDNHELVDHSQRACQLAGKLGARHLESVSLVYASRVSAAGGDTQNAVKAAEAAFGLASSTEYAEGLWRAAAALGALTGDEGMLRSAIAVLDRLRSQLIESGLTDSLLENVDCRQVYIELITLLKREGKLEQAAEAAELANWPPFSALLR